MISVVIPLYNKEGQIAETLNSVLAQTYTDYEIIVVDDGSTDRSAEIVESFSDSRIRLIRQQNAGVSAARNRGIEEANGKYIALLDADDLWDPIYLETIINLFKKYPTCEVSATNYKFIDKEGRVSFTTIKGLSFDTSIGLLDNYFEVASVSSPPFCSICISATKNAFLSIGGFPIGIKSGEDLVTWAKLACKYNIAYCAKPLAIYKLGYSVSRPPEPIDVVGQQLKQILQENPSANGIKKYIAYWYKMRMCRCLAHKFWNKGVIAFFKSLRHNPFQWKIFFSIFKYSNIGLR